MAQRQAVLGQQRLGLRAAQAGLERGGHRVGVDREQPVEPDQVERDHSGVAPLRDQPADDRGAAAEGDQRDVVDTHHSMSAATSSCVPGRTTASGESEPSPARSLSRSGVDLPRVRCSRVSWSVSTCSAPTISGEPGQQPAGQRLAQPYLGGIDGGCRVVPMKASTSSNALCDSAVASAGSPHRDQCISGVLDVLMCYIVTHDVNLVTTTRRPSPVRCRLRDDRYLDAAREAILAVGWSRTTLTDIARRAGVSRMTLYRRWPDTQTLLADLMTREWGRVVDEAVSSLDPAADPLRRITEGVVATVRGLRADELLRRIIDVDPEVLLPYLLDRRGRSQDFLAAALAGLIRKGQRHGSIRDGDADVLARSLLLACHGFALSAQTMTDSDTPASGPRRRRQRVRPPARPPRRTVPAAMTQDQNRKIHVGLADIPETTDVLVIGLGITGAGVALDAATRGLDVVAVDAHDVAFGTSRWSSKLVHGGLRYLAKGQLDVAHESAVERGILMQTTAPHLVRALPMLMPLTPSVSRVQATLARSGIRAGDLLRLAARTRRETLPRPRRIGVTETLTLAPVVRREGLRGAILSWDGQLEDDVRLVLGVARTAAANGARVHTKVRVSEALGDSATLTDCPHRRVPHHPRPHGDQRHRCLGRRAGPGDLAAAQPRHPHRAAQGHPARRPLRRDGAGAGCQQPLRLRPPPARPDLLRRADRRGGRRRDPRRAGAAGGGHRLPAAR